MLKPLYDLPRGTKGAVHSAHLDQLELQFLLMNDQSHFVFISSHCLKDAFGIPEVLIESPNVCHSTSWLKSKFNLGNLMPCESTALCNVVVSCRLGGSVEQTASFSEYSESRHVKSWNRMGRFI